MNYSLFGFQIYGVKKMKKIIRFIVILVNILLALFLFAQEQQSNGVPTIKAPDLRFSTTDEYVRVVLDVFENRELKFTEKINSDSVVITIMNLEIKNAITKSINDKLVKNATLTSDKSKNAVITIKLTDERTTMLTSMPFEEITPGEGAKKRFVIDIPRNINNKTYENIADHLLFMKHEFTEFGYQKLDLLLIKKGSKFKVSYSAGGETVSQFITREKARAGINGGFFMNGPAPLGLLKTDEGIVSMPLYKRATIAFDSSSSPNFFNPSGTFKVHTAFGDFTAEDWISASRDTVRHNLKVITFTSKIEVPKNDYGNTYIVKDGKVTFITKEKYALKSGEIALNAIFEAHTKLENTLKVGSAVTITPSISGMDITKYAYALAAGPKLITGGKIVDFSKNAEHFQDDVLKGKAIRSAIMLHRDGRIILVSTERNMSLKDLSTYLQRFGAVEALNLDGGGSTQMRSDKGALNALNYSRKLTSAILVF